jgi:hypothetical protein
MIIRLPDQLSSSLLLCRWNALVATTGFPRYKRRNFAVAQLNLYLTQCLNTWEGFVSALHVKYDIMTFICERIFMASLWQLSSEQIGTAICGFKREVALSWIVCDNDALVTLPYFLLLHKSIELSTG